MSSKRTGIQLAYPFEEKRLIRWNQWPLLTQPKLDGERCRAMLLEHSNEVLLLSSSEELIRSVPHINEFLRLNWPQKLPVGIELDGELYRHGWNFEQIHSIVSRTRNFHSDSGQIHFACFDIILPELTNARRELIRMQGLSIKGLPAEPVQLVPSKLAANLEELIQHYSKYLDEGYEGIIVRHPFAFYERRRSTWMLKFKPRKRDTYLIVGAEAEVSQTGEVKNRLGALWLESDGERFKVGTGFSHEQREKYWEIFQDGSLLGRFCDIDYQSLTPDRKVPKFASFVSLT